MEDFEKLGVFYLGRVVDPADGKEEDRLLLYDSKDLTTHAVCVGMTGSGKTGLGITILEEAAIDKIPAIIIDPKGDLNNLKLAFPHLSADEFAPWVDENEAARNGKTGKAAAEEIAKTWKEGLAQWGETSQRVQNYKNSVETVIYTPANTAGIPISILSSFAAPSAEFIADAGAMRDKVQSLTSSLLGLLGINADPLKSREHILIATIIDKAWRQGKDLDITSLIQQIQKPPFEKIGALDIDTFFSPKDRLELSVSLNNLLASPGFQAWMEGVPLDIKELLYTPEGRPRHAIMSIAHLSDSERMFFVTLLLNEVISWMRRQPGTSSLRAILYMDEIYGFFPPIANPPSKGPMLTLLKQARAFGLGIVLCTQNPVDLDYKGLANCGTWFIGKLQTERDKARVLEGLKTASNGDIDAATLDSMLAQIAKRTFLMRSIYLKDPVLFRTRWTLSYLRGPLTLTQIAQLTDRNGFESKPAPVSEPKTNSSSSAPMIPPDVTQYFVRSSKGSQANYKAKVLAIGKLHFVDAKNKIDVWEDIYWVAPVDGDEGVLWDEGSKEPDLKQRLEKEPPTGVFAEVPAGLMKAKNYSSYEKAFAAFLYQSEALTLYQSSEPKLMSNVGESEGDFRVRVGMVLREKRDALKQTITNKYADKIAVLTDKLHKAEEKVTAKQQKSGWQKAETLISFGTTLLGAFLGKGVTKGTISQAGTSLRRAGKIGADSQDVSRAEGDVQQVQQQLQDLQQQMQAEIDKISAPTDPASLTVQSTEVRPRKSDISVEKVALVWVSE